MAAYELTCAAMTIHPFRELLGLDPGRFAAGLHDAARHGASAVHEYLVADARKRQDMHNAHVLAYFKEGRRQASIRARREE